MSKIKYDKAKRQYTLWGVPYSISYVKHKTAALEAWLSGRGVWLAATSAADGSIVVMERYLRAVRKVEYVCQRDSVVCDVLLHEALVMWEEFDVAVRWLDGSRRIARGRVVRKGGVIAHYELVKIGNRVGRKIMPWHKIELYTT